MSKEVAGVKQAIPARIESEYKDMVISQLKEEIFELRRNQVHLDKLSSMVESLENKCRGFERDKDRICADYEDNIKRQKDFIDDLRKQISRLERQNDVLESRCNDKDREIQDMRRRTADAESNVKSGLHSNIKAEGQLAKKEEKLQSTLTALREAQTLLKNAETKIESQKKEITTDKQLIGDLKQMNTDLKNKFEGLLSLRRRTERDCASQEGKTLEKTKENEELTFKNDNLSKKLAEANERNEQLKETIQKLVEELDVLSNQDEKARTLLNHKEAIENIKSHQKELEKNNRPRSRVNY